MDDRGIRDRELVRDVLWVGLAPWALGALVWTALLVSADGFAGASIVLRDLTHPLLLAVPPVATALHLAAGRVTAGQVGDRTARAFVVAAVVGAAATVLLLVVRLVDWGIVSGYLPLLVVASGVRAAGGAAAVLPRRPVRA